MRAIEAPSWSTGEEQEFTVDANGLVIRPDDRVCCRRDGVHYAFRIVAIFRELYTRFAVVKLEPEGAWKDPSRGTEYELFLNSDQLHTPGDPQLDGWCPS